MPKEKSTQGGLGGGLQIERRSVHDLSNDPANARKHNDKNIEAIIASLRRFGQQKPIVIDRNNIVRAGNGTLEAARRLQWESIDCVVTSLNGSDAVAYAIADNRTAELAEWDEDTLAAQLNGLLSESEELALSAGFTPEEIEAMVALAEDEPEVTEDDVPEPPVDPITKPGDLWLLGDHRLLCGDSTKSEDVKRLMNGAKANLCFTSPPYADMRKYSGNDLCVEKLATIFESFGSHCELYLINLGMQFKNDEVYPYWDTWIEIAKQSGFKLLSWLIWDRINATSVSSQKKMFAVTHEWIFVFGKKTFEINRTWEKSEESKKREIYYRTNSAGQKVTTRRQKDGSVKESVIGEVFSNKNMGTVFTCYAEMRRDLDHPARFPIEFPSAYIESLTNDGGLVCEPFCGSGTTLIAAEQLGRKCYGMEISPQYCDMIVKRWETLTGRQAVLET